MGPGGETTDNLGELNVKVRTERHGKGDIWSRMTFQGAKVRKLLLAVSGVIVKGHIVVFDGSGSFILPNSYAGVESVRKAITGVQGRSWNILGHSNGSTAAGSLGSHGLGSPDDSRNTRRRL